MRRSSEAGSVWICFCRFAILEAVGTIDLLQSLLVFNPAIHTHSGSECTHMATLLECPKVMVTRCSSALLLATRRRLNCSSRGVVTQLFVTSWTHNDPLHASVRFSTGIPCKPVSGRRRRRHGRLRSRLPPRWCRSVWHMSPWRPESSPDKVGVE